MDFVLFDDLFFEFLTLLFGGHNFLNSKPFLTIFSAPDVPIRRVQVFVWTPKTTKPSPWIQPALIT
jgi:hypothetical protein